MNPWWSTLWHSDWAGIAWGVVLTMTLVAAVLDLRTRRIPNLLTIPCFVVGLIFAGLTAGWVGLGDALAGAALAMLPFVLMFLFVGGGAGDAKLMAAIGAWLGVVGGITTLAAVLIVGAVAALVYAIARGQLTSVWNNLSLMAIRARAASRGQTAYAPALPDVRALNPMPYGPSIFIGAVAAMIVSLGW